MQSFTTVLLVMVATMITYSNGQGGDCGFCHDDRNCSNEDFCPRAACCNQCAMSAYRCSYTKHTGHDNSCTYHNDGGASIVSYAHAYVYMTLGAHSMKLSETTFAEMHVWSERAKWCCESQSAECDEPAYCTDGTDCSDCGNCNGHRRNLEADDAKSAGGNNVMDPFER